MRRTIRNRLEDYLPSHWPLHGLGNYFEQPPGAIWSNVHSLTSSVRLIWAMIRPIWTDILEISRQMPTPLGRQACRNDSTSPPGRNAAEANTLWNCDFGVPNIARKSLARGYTTITCSGFTRSVTKIEGNDPEPSALVARMRRSSGPPGSVLRLSTSSPEEHQRGRRDCAIAWHAQSGESRLASLSPLCTRRTSVVGWGLRVPDARAGRLQASPERRRSVPILPLFCRQRNKKRSRVPCPDPISPTMSGPRSSAFPPRHRGWSSACAQLARHQRHLGRRARPARSLPRRSRAPHAPLMRRSSAAQAPRALLKRRSSAARAPRARRLLAACAPRVHRACAAGAAAA